MSASAKRDWAQKPQSSAQPPDLALTSEHMSVESPKCSTPACHARSTSASISAWSSISPSVSASSRVISGGKLSTFLGVRDCAQGRRAVGRRALACDSDLRCPWLRLHPAENRGYRELYAFSRQLAEHWAALAGRRPGSPVCSALANGARTAGG